MRKWKAWLCGRFLPVWCREEMQEETRRLTQELAAARAENEVLRGYIDGMRDALRYGRKINIYAGGDDHGHRIGAAPSAANPEL